MRALTSASACIFSFNGGGVVAARTAIEFLSDDIILTMPDSQPSLDAVENKFPARDGRVREPLAG